LNDKFKDSWDFIYNKYLGSNKTELKSISVFSFFQIQKSQKYEIEMMIQQIYDSLGANNYTLDEILENYDSIYSDPKAKFLADLSIISNYNNFTDLPPEFVPLFPLYENTNYDEWSSGDEDLKLLAARFVLFKNKDIVKFSTLTRKKFSDGQDFFKQFEFKKNVYELPQKSIQNPTEFLNNLSFSSLEKNKHQSLITTLNPISVIYTYKNKYIISGKYKMPYLDYDLNPTNKEVELPPNVKKYKTSGEVFGIFLYSQQEHMIYHSKNSSFTEEYVYANGYSLSFTLFQSE